jgi:hypothetical protein
MSTQTFTLPCPAVQLPTIADLTNIFNKIAQLPADLIVLAGKYALMFGKDVVDALYNQAQSIAEVLEKIIEIISAIVPDIPNPLFGDLNIPQFEWEKRIQALIQNFHMFLQNQLLSIIDKVLPINFTISVLGLSIDVLAMLSGNAAKIFASIKEQVLENIDDFFKLLPDAYKAFCGLFDFDVPTLKLQVILDYIMAKLNGGLLTLLFGAFTGLIKKFKTIWDTLGLPALPLFIDLNMEGILGAIIEEALEVANRTIEAAKQLYQGAVDAAKKIAEVTKIALTTAKEFIIKAFEALSFSLPIIGTFDVFSMIGGEITDFVQSLEKRIYRMMQAFRDFSFNGPKMILLDWMGKVTAFFNAIGLGALVQWISFDFCKFLKLIGFPTKIRIETDNLDLSGDPNLVPG